jgi:16S rRNA (guanine(966)-N(2))-methyltransferase RsmD
MRVITGKAKGRKLKTLEGNDVRPTTDKVKEAVFSAIQFEIEGARVIDLFSGSGQMGIEALSRGADYAVFTDISKRSLDVTRENLESTGFLQQSRLINTDGIEFIKNTAEKFDIAILDPPYRHGLIEKTLSYLVKIMNDNGIIICEHEKELELDECDRLNIRKKYSYGKISVTLFSVSREE